MAKVLRRRRKPVPGEKVGPAIRPSASIAQRYSADLTALVDRAARGIEVHVRELFTGQDASIGSQARITTNALIRRFERLFRRKSDELAEQMIGRVDRDATGKLVRSLRDISGDTTLTASVLRQGATSDVLKASVAENVQLIRSISQQYLGDVQGIVMRAIAEGNGLADIVPQLQKRHGITLRRARLIANDQVRKATSAINRSRAEANGIRKFQWVHSGGGREPRELHLRLDGEVFEYANPPVIDERTGERGLPGQLINCRCVQRPVIDFSPVDSPVNGV